MLPIPLQKPEKITTFDTFITVFICILSFLVNFYRLDFPDCVCFDEVHFGNFTNWYSLSQYFFDIHPPLGKLVMYAIANFSEYNASINFEKYYGHTHDTTEYIVLRMTPAFFSALCYPLIYLTMRFSSFSYIASAFAALMALFDTSLLTEHRFILSDGMLHFFCCLFLMVYAQTSTNKIETLEGNNGVIIAALFLGAACACKNTAWGLMGLVAYVETLSCLQFYKRFDDHFLLEYFYRGFISFGLVVIFHVFIFFVHLFLIPYSGRDVDESESHLYINRVFPTAELWGKRLVFPNLYIRTVQLIIGMHFGNMQITSFHPYMSRPINWPLLTGNYVAFWHGSNGRSVACMGNLFVYYIAFLGLIMVVISPIKFILPKVSKRFSHIYSKIIYFNSKFIKKYFKTLLVTSKHEKNQNEEIEQQENPKWSWQKFLLASRFFVGWAFSYFPFYLIPRSMYLYHYNIPLMFGCMAAGASLDLWFSRYSRGIVAVLLLFIVLVGFYIWSPISYGTTHLPNKYVFWTSVWQHGDAYHKMLASQERNKSRSSI